jgi:radical SAM superfamily enzyme YgiQ (UPF0313 family)
MYATKRFKMRDVQEVVDELGRVAEQAGSYVRRVFLADGDPMVLPTDRMVRILEACRELFAGLERVATYATPQNILKKQLAELERIRKAGLTMLYFGVESGDDEVLREVEKGAGSAEIIEAAAKAHRAGFVLSTTVLLGLAGREKSLRHARRTGEVLSRIDPRYASALTVMEPDGRRQDEPSIEPARATPDRPWREMDAWSIMAELRELIAEMSVTDCVFRTNHASNYLPLKGDLPRDRSRLLEQLDEVLQAKDPARLRPELARGL